MVEKEIQMHAKGYPSSLNLYHTNMDQSSSKLPGNTHDTSDNFVSIIPYATLRLRGTHQLSIEEHANAIASHLQLSNRLMRDDPDSELLRMETLRAMPQSLTVKRSVKNKLQATVLQKTKKKNNSFSCWKWFKHTWSFTFGKIQMVLQNVKCTMEPWYYVIRLIEGRFGSGVAAYFKFLRWLIMINIISCLLSIIFVVLPQTLDRAYESQNFNGMDLLTGSGFFTNTILYYGFYTNGTVHSIFSSTYSISSAYCLTLLCSYMFTFVILSVKVISSYRNSFIDVHGKACNLLLYSNKVFCGWDFGISSSKAANVQAAYVYRELTELLAEAEKRTHPHCLAKCAAFCVRIIVTLAVFAMICGTGVLLWILLKMHKADKSKTTSTMIAPFTITAIMYIFPTIISWIARFENYSSKRTKLYVTVVRVHAMAAAIIGVLLVFWLINSTSDCWQTELGEEIYRLILLDLLFTIFGILIFEVLRAALRRNAGKDIRRFKFDIARNTLNLIYNQTLFWLGYYFSPLMSALIILKMVLIFYLRRYSLSRYYDPSPRPWRAAQTQTLFLALAFLGMIGVLIVLGYAIANVQSNECGPFREYDYTWDYVVNGVLSLKRDSVFWRIVTELTRPAIGAAILIAMCVGVYCLRAKAEASKELILILQVILILQSRDKEFLLKSFSKVVDDRYKRYEGNDRTECKTQEESSSGTGRYSSSTADSRKDHVQ